MTRQHNSCNWRETCRHQGISGVLKLDTLRRVSAVLHLCCSLCASSFVGVVRESSDVIFVRFMTRETEISLITYTCMYTKYLQLQNMILFVPVSNVGEWFQLSFLDFRWHLDQSLESKLWVMILSAWVTWPPLGQGPGSVSIRQEEDSWAKTLGTIITKEIRLARPIWILL